MGLTRCSTLLVLLGMTSAFLPNDQEVMLARSSTEALCHALRVALSNQTSFPGDGFYDRRQSGFWTAQQAELRPACVVTPTNTSDVVDVLEVVKAHGGRIAIVSGGHSSNTGASNIHNGVTMDLSSLDEVTISKDRAGVWIGPGARWGNVYATLEPYNLTVAGGRLSHVGVGGFVLGGGISWHENRVGFACDTVTAFEFVTPDLRVIQATKEDHVDLFWALKGSLGAFGVVTRIKMDTLPTNGIFAGSISFTEHHLPQALGTLDKMANDVDADADTQGYISFAYLGSTKDFVYLAYLVNTNDDDDTESLQAWKSIPFQHSTLRHTSVGESAEEVSRGNEMGMRRRKFTFTLSLDTEMLMHLHQLISDFAHALNVGEKDLLGITCQPLTVPMLNRARNSNIFAETFSHVHHPLVLVSVELWWQEQSADERYEQALRRLEDELVAATAKESVEHPWTYSNYAARWQEPLHARRLGKGTTRRLQAVKLMYDPHDLWRDLVPGAWQL